MPEDQQAKHQGMQLQLVEMRRDQQVPDELYWQSLPIKPAVAASRNGLLNITENPNTPKSLRSNGRSDTEIY